MHCSPHHHYFSYLQTLSCTPSARHQLVTPTHTNCSTTTPRALPGCEKFQQASAINSRPPIVVFISHTSHLASWYQEATKRTVWTREQQAVRRPLSLHAEPLFRLSKWLPREHFTPSSSRGMASLLLRQLRSPCVTCFFTEVSLLLRL